MSNSKKLLQSASGYIDQTSGGTDVKNVFNMIQWTGSNGYSKNFADNYYSGFNIYGGAGTSDPKSGAMILKNTKQQESAEIYYNSSSGSSSTRALTLDKSPPIFHSILEVSKKDFLKIPSNSFNFLISSSLIGESRSTSTI